MKKNGFTIVELVIVIAVIAVLAAVMIPTFSGIVEKANISSDTQLVRNMNIILAAECAGGSAPEDVSEVTDILGKNGIESFAPKTNGYSFYWIRSENVIVLANGEGTAVYPEENADEVFNSANWFALSSPEEATVTSAPETTEVPDHEPQIFNVTVRQSGASVTIPFEIPETATEGQPFHLELTIPVEMQDRHLIEKLTANMTDGDTQHRFVARSELGEITGQDSPFLRDETAVLDIPCVTGDISINITIREYTIITLRGDHFREGKNTFRVLEYDKTKKLYIDDSIIQDMILEEGYRIKSAKGTQNGRDLGELYDPQKNCIKSSAVLLNSDIEIELEVEELAYTVEIIIQNDGNERGRSLQTVYYPYRCSLDLNSILNNRKVEILHTGYDPESVYTDEESRPIFDYNKETNIITLSSIKRSFKLICTVALEE